MQFVQNHLDELGVKRGVNWSCLRYMLGEVQYGGRVTDDLDKHLLNTFTRVWFSESTFADKFCFYKGYTIPKAKNVPDYLLHIETLPLVDSPEVRGGRDVIGVTLVLHRYFLLAVSRQFMLDRFWFFLNRLHSHWSNKHIFLYSNIQHIY